jgi:hypothetical protein
MNNWKAWPVGVLTPEQTNTLESLMQGNTQLAGNHYVQQWWG